MIKQQCCFWTIFSSKEYSVCASIGGSEVNVTMTLSVLKSVWRCSLIYGACSRNLGGLRIRSRLTGLAFFSPSSPFHLPVEEHGFALHKVEMPCA